MSHKAALVIAAAVTAFFMVIFGGLLAAVVLPAARAAAPSAAPTVLQPVTVAPSATPEPAAADQQVAVSPDMAAAIALAAAPGAALNSPPDLVLFQNIVAYEVSLDQGLVYVDANTGAVLSNGAAAAAVPPVFGRGEGEGREHGGDGFWEGGFDD